MPTYKDMGEVPRAGNDSGGGQLGNAVHCKPHGANDWLYVVVQEAVWEDLAKRIGPEVGVPDLAADPRVATIAERRKNQQLVWTLLNKFAEKYTKRELMAILNPLDVPCGPIMSTEDLATDEHVRGRDMWVELDHPQRGKWWNVGMPIKLSDSPARIERSPTLGEHTDEILRAGARLRRVENRRPEAGGRVLACRRRRPHEDRDHRAAGLRQRPVLRGVPRARRPGRGRFLRAGEAGRAPRRARRSRRRKRA